MVILIFCGFFLILCEICMSVYYILLGTKHDKIYYTLLSMSFVLIIMKNIYKNIYGDCYCFVSLVKSQLNIIIIIYNMCSNCQFVMK